MHLPVGNPRDSSYLLPLVDKVPHAMMQVAAHPTLEVPSLEGALPSIDTSRYQARPVREIITAGLPHPIKPLTPSPTNENVLRNPCAAGLNRK